MRKLDLIIENIRDEYMINLLEEGTASELESLKTKRFLNENLNRIRNMLIEEGAIDSVKNHLGNNWGKYLGAAGTAGLGYAANEMGAFGDGGENVDYGEGSEVAANNEDDISLGDEARLAQSAKLNAMIGSDNTDYGDGSEMPGENGDRVSLGDDARLAQSAAANAQIGAKAPEPGLMDAAKNFYGNVTDQSPLANYNQMTGANDAIDASIENLTPEQMREAGVMKTMEDLGQQSERGGARLAAQGLAAGAGAAGLGAVGLGANALRNRLQR